MFRVFSLVALFQCALSASAGIQSTGYETTGCNITFAKTVKLENSTGVTPYVSGTYSTTFYGCKSWYYRTDQFPVRYVG